MDLKAFGFQQWPPASGSWRILKLMKLIEPEACSACIIGVVEKPKQTMCPEELLHLTDTQFYMELRFLSDLLAAGLLQPSFRRSCSTSTFTAKTKCENTLVSVLSQKIAEKCRAIAMYAPQECHQFLTHIHLAICGPPGVVTC